MVRSIVLGLLMAVGLAGCHAGSANDAGQQTAARSPILTVPKHPGALYLAMSQKFIERADQLMQSGKYAAATVALSDALAADPSNAKIIYMRANIFLRIGLLDEAIADLSRAIDAEASPVYYLSRCGAYFATGRWVEAISDCTDTIRLSPMEKDAYLLRAMTHYSNGDLERAMADALVVLMIRPNDPNARSLIQEILQERERRERGYPTQPALKTDVSGDR